MSVFLTFTLFLSFFVKKQEYPPPNSEISARGKKSQKRENPFERKNSSLTEAVKNAIMDRKISDRRKEKNVMKNVILTGDRPTGKLHIGHYVGSLKRRVELQNSGASIRSIS